MRKVAFAIALLTSTAVLAQPLPTEQQYFANEIATKTQQIGQLLNQLHAAQAQIADLQKQLAETKRVNDATPTVPEKKSK